MNRFRKKEKMRKSQMQIESKIYKNPIQIISNTVHSTRSNMLKLTKSKKLKTLKVIFSKIQDCILNVLHLLTKQLITKKSWKKLIKRNKIKSKEQINKFRKLNQPKNRNNNKNSQYNKLLLKRVLIIECNKYNTSKNF